MKKIIFVTFTALVCLLFLVYWIGREFFGIDSGAVSATMTACVTVFIAIVTLLVTKHLEKKALIEKEIRDNKIPIYNEFVKLYYENMMAQKTGKSMPQQELVRRTGEIVFGVMLWGPDSIIQKFHALQRQIYSVDKDHKKTLDLLGDFLLAVRFDLGHDNKGISKRTLLGMFVTDIDNVLKE